MISQRLKFLTMNRAVLAMAISVSLTNAAAYAQYGAGDYGTYFEQGSALFKQERTTDAIEMFKKALPLAGDMDVSAVYNNLSAAYIKRGNYFQRVNQYEAALNDFRNALFYLDAAWPDGIPKKPIHERNLSVTVQNLNHVYQLLNLNANDKSMHLSQARQLRAKGALQEAIVEYAQAYKMDSKDAEASKALGDLFNVVNMPAKSQKYYQVAGDTLGDKADDDLYVQQANAAYKAGNIDQAVKLYNKALDLDPKNESALNQLEKIWLNEIKFNNASVLGHANLASVYQKKKMYEQALQQYNAAEHFGEMNRATPFDVKKLIRLNVGTLFQETKQYQMALTAYDTVLRSDPNNVQALTYKATLLKEVGRPEESAAQYQKILSIDPNNAAAQQELMGAAMQAFAADPVKNAQGLKDYAERSANNADIQAKVGEEFHRVKNYDEAAFYYQRSIHLNPKMAAAYANLGAVYQAQGKDAESTDAYREALKLDPSNKAVKDLLAQAESNIGAENFQQAVNLQQEGKHAEALPYFQKALAQSPNNAELIAAYGISLQNTGKQDEAIRQYQKAIQLNPSDGDYHYYLATAYHQKNQLPQAIQSYKKALQLKPELTEAKQALAALDQQESGAALQKAIDAYNGKRYPQALVSVNEALAKNNRDAMAHYYKGLILQAQKNNAGACASYRQATQLDSNFADAYYALGILSDEMKDYPAAKGAYDQFVRLSENRDDEFVKYAQERLKDLASQ